MIIPQWKWLFSHYIKSRSQKRKHHLSNDEPNENTDFDCSEKKCNCSLFVKSFFLLFDELLWFELNFSVRLKTLSILFIPTCMTWTVYILEIKKFIIELIGWYNWEWQMRKFKNIPQIKSKLRNIFGLSIPKHWSEWF